MFVLLLRLFCSENFCSWGWKVRWDSIFIANFVWSRVHHHARVVNYHTLRSTQHLAIQLSYSLRSHSRNPSESKTQRLGSSSCKSWEGMELHSEVTESVVPWGRCWCSLGFLQSECAFVARDVGTNLFWQVNFSQVICAAKGTWFDVRHFLVERTGPLGESGGESLWDGSQFDDKP